MGSAAAPLRVGRCPAGLGEQSAVVVLQVVTAVVVVVVVVVVLVAE